MNEEPTILDAVIDLEKRGEYIREYMQEKVAAKLSLKGIKRGLSKAKEGIKKYHSKAKKDALIAAGKKKKWFGLKDYTMGERARAGGRAALRYSPHAAAVVGAGAAGKEYYDNKK